MEYTYSNQCNTNKNNNCSRLSNISYPSRTVVHAKLEMTEPGDHDEQEADAVANTIAAGGKISRKISGGSGYSGVTVSNQMESQLNHLQGGGQAMPTGLRSMMESGFGQDFSHVRLHTDSAAASLSSSIHAKAFTHGNDIYFNQGQFSPNTTEGQKLMAHELTHVVQGSGKIGKDDINSDICGDLRIPDFDSCFDESSPESCISNKRNDFHQDFIEKCTDGGEKNVTVRDEWIKEQINRLKDNNRDFKDAVNIFYSKIQEIDENLISFSCNSVKDGFLLALGVAEVFINKKGVQAALEVIKGFGGSSELGKFISNLEEKNDYIIMREQLNYVSSSITEALVSMYEIYKLIVNIDKSEHHFNTISSTTQKNYNTVAYLQTLISKEDLLKIRINRIDERQWLFYLAQWFIESHLEHLYEDDDDNDDLYYDVNAGEMANNGTFNPVKKEHKLINKVIETFFLGKTYPKARNTDQYKSSVDALKKYNDKTRKKFRIRAQEDALKETIYFDKNEFHYIDNGVNHYYIDWLNAVMDMGKYDSVEKLPKEDREFNSKIYPQLWNKAIKESEKNLNIYFDGHKYIQNGINDFFVNSLNCIIEIEKDFNNKGSEFNSKIYPKLWNKALNESKKKLNIYFDGHKYIQNWNDDFYVDALNVITKLNNKKNEGNKFNESIYDSLYKEALKYDNIYFNGQEYDQIGEIDDFFVDALNVIIKLNNKKNEGKGFNQKVFSKLQNKLRNEYRYGKDYEVSGQKYVWNGDSFSRRITLDYKLEPTWLKTLNLIIEVNNINIVP